jgi:hypothetical protein
LDIVLRQEKLLICTQQENIIRMLHFGDQEEADLPPSKYGGKESDERFVTGRKNGRN